jgi:hypothetical protein
LSREESWSYGAYSKTSSWLHEASGSKSPSGWSLETPSRTQGAAVQSHEREALPLVVAEGSTLAPSAVLSRITERSRAVWLIPTTAFQRAQLSARGTTGGHAQLYALLGQVIEREVRDHSAPMLWVDGSKGIAEMVDAVEQMFGDALAAGPHAQTTKERQALLREMNEAIASQVRGYYARPRAEGDPEVVVRKFVCECGDPACDLDVLIPVGQLSTGRHSHPDTAFALGEEWVVRQDEAEAREELIR